MKNLLILFLAPLLLFAAAIQERKIPEGAIQNLCRELGMPPDEDVVGWTQKSWLRKGGIERWEMQELSPSQKEFVLEWAREQGLYSSWQCKLKEYDRALILGATTGHMQLRLNYLKQQWESGVRFCEIVWLLGDRPLDPKVDQLLEGCQTESDAAHRIWEESDLPEEMRSLPLIYVTVPMDGARRPNTADTLIAWLKTDPFPGTSLFVSTQPFCGYQYGVIKGVLPDACAYDVIGPGIDPSSHPAAAAITLDSVARWLYCE
ncbi:MAG: hypothetical protein JSS61_00005 [Verrucomicrobia bacterium]|nr:hypothetical protein [Verrucomicrobiota bacterium]